MYDIENSKKKGNWIVVFYKQKGEKKIESFNYQDTI